MIIISLLHLQGTVDFVLELQWWGSLFEKV